MRYLFLMMLATSPGFGWCDSDNDGDTDTDTDTGPAECTMDLGEYDGHFAIRSQSDIATLAGYTSISGELVISCPACRDLSELICLTSVGDLFFICDSFSLTNLDGLDALTSVGGEFRIWGCSDLTSLDGLGAFTYVSEAIVIHHNESLPDCEVCDLLDQFTTEPPYIGVGTNLNDVCTPVPSSCP